MKIIRPFWYYVIAMALFGASLVFGQQKLVKQVDTISDLKNQNVNDIHKSIEVLGGTIRGDGKGGLYFWNSLSSASADDAEVVQSNGTPSGRWVRAGITASGSTTSRSVNERFSDTINILDYGADSTGVADSTTAIQNALNAALGKRVFIPKGSYSVTTLSLAANNARLFGSGALLARSAVDQVLSVSATNVSIYGITINGNTLANRGIVWLPDSSGSMEDCLVINIFKSPSQSLVCAGIRICGETDVTVENCTVDGVNSPTDGVARGILVSVTSSEEVPHRVHISGGFIKNITPVNDGDAIVIQNSWPTNCNVTIDGVFLDGEKRGVKIMSPGVIVKGCTIKNSEYAGVSVYAGNSSVIGNLIYNYTGDNGIEVGTTFWTITNVFVSGNQIHREPSDPITTDTAGIKLIGTNLSQISIFGNTINRAYQGIHATAGISFSQIDGNVVNDAQNGVIIEGYSTYYPFRVGVSHNTFSGITNYGVRFLRGTNFVANGNRGQVASGFQLVDRHSTNVEGYEGHGNSGDFPGFGNYMTAFREKVSTISGTIIDLSLANAFTKTITSSQAYTFSNPPLIGNKHTVLVKLINNSGVSLTPVSFTASGYTTHLTIDAIPTGGVSEFTFDIYPDNTLILGKQVNYSASGTDIIVAGRGYGSDWNGSLKAPSEDSVHDIVQSLVGSDAVTVDGFSVDGAGLNSTPFDITLVLDTGSNPDVIDFYFARVADIATNPSLQANWVTFGTSGVVFEGATVDDFEGLLTLTDPTADRTWTLPNASGTIMLQSDILINGFTTAGINVSGYPNDITVALDTGTTPDTVDIYFARAYAIGDDPTLGAGHATFGTSGVLFEGATVNGFEGLLDSADVTADRTWTLPDQSGTLGIAFNTGLGITNIANVLSNNIVAGTGISITAGANGQLTMASTVTADGEGRTNYDVVTTTDVTVTPIYTNSVPNNSTVVIFGTVQAIDSGSLHGMTREFIATYQNVAGTVTQLGFTYPAEHYDATDNDQWVISSNISGTDVVIRVQNNEASGTVRWIMRARSDTFTY